MVDYTIRQAVRSDLGMMFRLFRESVQQINSADYTPGQIAAWLGKATAERWAELFDSDLCFFVAECGKELAGFASADASGHLHSLYVSPVHQRQGVAAALLRTAIRYANEHTAACISTEASITARPFFEKAGFATRSEQQVCIDTERLVNYVMELKLAPALELRDAASCDLPRIMEIIRQAQVRMRVRGSLQWQDGYPAAENIESDIRHGYGLVLCDGDRILAYSAVIFGHEPAYDAIRGKWLSGGNYVVVHRLAVADGALGRGIASGFMQRIETLARQRGVASLRVDTNFDNAPMLRVLDTQGFIYCGEIIYGGAPRVAFEKLLG